MKPLDFVLTPKGQVAIIKEINNTQNMLSASITFIGKNEIGEHSAWYRSNELTVIDNLPNLLSRTMCHPFGAGKELANSSYPF